MPRSIDLESGFCEKTPILQPSESRRRHRGIPARISFGILGCFGFFNVYTMRVNLSVAMVAMVGKRADAHAEGEHMACRELLPPFNSSDANSTAMAGQFDWDIETQAMILGAFFMGYVCTQIPGGILAEKYGAKWLFGIGLLITSIFTLLTPLAAEWGVPALVACRAIEGLGEGVTYPAMNVLIGRWIPKLERSRAVTIIFNGSAVGTVVSLFLSGYISSSDKLGGWPTVFYLFGCLGCVWFVLWVIFIYESPEVHPRISREELEYIRAGQDHVQSKRRGDIPWFSILTSCPVWALTVAHFGFNWGFYTLLTELPTYLSNILHFDLAQNGLLSALPYVCQAIFAFMASLVADSMRASGRFRVTTIRKLMNSIAFFVPCILVGLVAFVGCMSKLIMTLIVTSVAFSGFMFSGFNVTHVDMSPEFAGTLMGITNCIANLTGFLAPRYVGLIIKDGQTVHKWGIIFLTTSGMYFVTGMIYNLFASAELQPWGITSQAPSRETERRTVSQETQRKTPLSETKPKTPSEATECKAPVE
uniref:Sialin n=1 Tax=Cupiennius salei TaxID=6928 RepID=A0A061QLM4_CUPSA